MALHNIKYYFTPVRSVGTPTKYLLRKAQPTNDEIRAWEQEFTTYPEWSYDILKDNKLYHVYNDDESNFVTDEAIGITGIISETYKPKFVWGCFIGKLFAKLYKVGTDELIASWDLQSLSSSMTEWLWYGVDEYRSLESQVYATTINSTDQFYMTFTCETSPEWNSASFHLHSRYYNQLREDYIGIYSFNWIEIPVITNAPPDPRGGDIVVPSVHNPCCDKYYTKRLEPRGDNCNYCIDGVFKNNLLLHGDEGTFTWGKNLGASLNTTDINFYGKI